MYGKGRLYMLENILGMYKIKWQKLSKSLFTGHCEKFPIQMQRWTELASPSAKSVNTYPYTDTHTDTHTHKLTHSHKSVGLNTQYIIRSSQQSFMSDCLF